MKFAEGLTPKQKFEAVERYILVHSMLYYEMNESVITDQQFDKIAKLLADKIKKMGPKKVKSTTYGYVFYDFDGTTGFDLIGRLTESDRTWITIIANSVLNEYKHRRY